MVVLLVFIVWLIFELIDISVSFTPQFNLNNIKSKKMFGKIERIVINERK